MTENVVFDEERFYQLDRQLLNVTQMAAISAARTAGHGNNHAADEAATKAMRYHLGRVRDTKFVVKIGEGERDKAPMLYIGEEIGTGPFQVDIAVDPLENTNATAKLGPNAICVLAASEPGGLLGASDGYMDKIVGGPKLVGKISILDSIEDTIVKVSSALNRGFEELTFPILDRDRHRDQIEKTVATGVRTQVIPDGDLVPGVFTCIPGSSTHCLYNNGGSPEGIITAVGVKILGGEMQALFIPKDDEDRKRLESLGIIIGKIYKQNELASGKHLMLFITAVTILTTVTKHILEGVSFFPGAAKTNSLIITDEKVEILSTIHILDREEFDRCKSEFRIL